MIGNSSRRRKGVGVEISGETARALYIEESGNSIQIRKTIEKPWLDPADPTALREILQGLFTGQRPGQYSLFLLMHFLV